MTDISAAIGLIELERYKDDTLVKRKYIFDAFNSELSKYDWAELPEYETSFKTSSYHLFPLRIKSISEDQRDEIIKRIFDEDVSVNVHFIPVPKLSFYVNKGYDIQNYPVALDNFKREISLPVFYDLTDEQLKMVLDAVIKSVKSVLN
jgi:dTDP-4-amino-4,6-dideoxygalactose transaminase